MIIAVQPLQELALGTTPCTVNIINYAEATGCETRPTNFGGIKRRRTPKQIEHIITHYLHDLAESSMISIEAF